VTIEPPIVLPYSKPYPWEIDHEPPCIGLCYHYKKLGMENPHADLEYYNK
jgi:hypothetical protein